MKLCVQTTPSIYVFVKKKLLGHGVCNTPDGRLILSDKELLLNFVKLERVSRLGCFDSVQSAVSDIANYTKAIGKQHLVLFAYMYLK